MADDPYATLGVPKSASDEDIRRAFRKLAKELHPDISKGNEERFKKVSSAYEILGDPEKRRAYDRGEIDGRGEPRHAGFRHYARGARAGAGAGAGGPFDEFGFGDIFSDIFGGVGSRAGGRPNFVSKGHDVRYTLEVDFLEAASGATKRVTLPGGGTLDLNVPAAVTDGQVLRLKGKGQRGAGGAEPGDALIEIRVRPHALFKREDDDILVEVPITIDEAVLGAKVEVPTISGRVQLTIPKGTSSGRVFRLKGKGVKSAGRAEAGDQLVTVKIVLPETVDDTLAYFFSEWRQKNRYDPGRK
ncbi:MAG: J domain-containing protein [Hyphomicrobium sp.]|uniref:DnaJ C-terminal domain-containing protein n=1 Tax=Hyphomicrobium sp. TaxID=82 RepID=UPI00132BD6FD|nr:DnaJ C-terminal domain-containing protein [Hyphomicrobium sp.]KAB2942262.1 MAG: DnaJ domain-containing protein [Hyphomicrobium sp.]MBZ0208404.1 J domain-containing protein [Hyphomicrobium sp.]